MTNQKIDQRNDDMTNKQRKMIERALKATPYVAGGVVYAGAIALAMTTGLNPSADEVRAARESGDYWNAYAPSAFIGMGALLMACSAYRAAKLWAENAIHKLWKSAAQHKSAWFDNDGSDPGYTLVNVERADGSIQWAVDGVGLEWDLQADNPIKHYYPARTDKAHRVRAKAGLTP